MLNFLGWVIMCMTCSQWLKVESGNYETRNDCRTWNQIAESMFENYHI